MPDPSPARNATGGGTGARDRGGSNGPMTGRSYTPRCRNCLERTLVSGASLPSCELTAPGLTVAVGRPVPGHGLRRPLAHPLHKETAEALPRDGGADDPNNQIEEEILTMKTQYLRATAAAAAVAALATVGCASTRTVGEQIDDGTITTKITTKLAADPEINPFNIDVDTLDGVVTLRGEVEKEEARAEAEKLARNTSGVLEVKNDIRVVPEEYEDDQSGSDAWITTKIKSKLTVDPQLNPFNIDVDTLDGVVTLSGRVKTREARRHAEELARETKGVITVDNDLEVEED